MSDSKLTLGMLYTSASKSSSKASSPPLIVKPYKPSDPASTRQKSRKDSGGEKKHQYEDSLSSLCTPGSTEIVLEYVIHENGDFVQLVSPGGKPIYRLQLKVNEHDGEVYRSSNGQLVGAWNENSRHSEEKLKLQFTMQGGKWEFSPENEVWLSQLGTLPKHEFIWMDFRDKSDADIGQDLYRTDGDDNQIGFSVRCIDNSDPSKRTVCAIMTDTHDHGTFTIPGDIIATLKQLDEMVTVGLAVMIRLRNENEDDFDNNRGTSRSSLGQFLRSRQY